MSFQRSKRPAAPSGPDRARVLQAARELFFSRGFRASTMSELAADLGMSKKTLYRLFPSKNALLAAILAERAGELRQALQRIGGDPALAVPQKLQRALAFVVGKLADIQPAFVYSLKRHAPAQYRQMDDLRRRNLETFLARMFAEGRARGMVRHDVTEPLAVEFLLGGIRAVLEPEVLNRLALLPAHAVGGVLDLLFQGLLTEKGKSAYVAR